MPDEKIPDWIGLAAAPWWESDLMPALQSCLAKVQADLCKPTKTKTIEDVRALQGRAAMLTDLMTAPGRQREQRQIEDEMKREEEEDAARRRQRGYRTES